MATIQLRTDDLNGETLPEDTPTTRLFIEDPRGDVSIEIDLSDASFKALQKAVDKIVSKGRPVEAPAPKKVGDDATEAKAARAWAIASGLQPPVSERGAVPKHAIVAYRAHLANTDQDAAEQEEDRVNSTEAARKAANDS